MLYLIYPISNCSLIIIIPLLKEVKPGWNCPVSITDKLCATLMMKWFHSLCFHVWPVVYQWVGIEKQE